jgi:hypothetical protein
MAPLLARERAKEIVLIELRGADLRERRRAGGEGEQTKKGDRTKSLSYPLSREAGEGARWQPSLS